MRNRIVIFENILRGQLARCERKLEAEYNRGRRHCPYYMCGGGYNRRGFKKTMRRWAYWSGKHNRIAIRIMHLTGEYPDMPAKCGVA